MSQVNKTTNDSEEKSLLRQPRATASWSRSGSRERLSRPSGDIPEEPLETPAMPRNITPLLDEAVITERVSMDSAAEKAANPTPVEASTTESEERSEELNEEAEEGVVILVF